MSLFMQAQLSDVQRKCDEANLILGDYDNAKKKVVIENADLLRQVSSASGRFVTEDLGFLCVDKFQIMLPKIDFINSHIHSQHARDILL